MNAALQPDAAPPTVPERRPAGTNGGNGSRRRGAPAPRRHAGRRLAAVLFLVGTVIAVSPERAPEPVTYAEGVYATESVMAQVPFDVQDLAATENARRRAANAAPYVYRVDADRMREGLDALAAVFANVEEIAAKEILSPEERRRLVGIAVRPTLSDVTVGLLIQPENLTRLREQSVGLVGPILERGVFSEQPLLSAHVDLVGIDGRRQELVRDDVTHLTGANRELEEACRTEAGDNTVLAATLYELASIALQPTVQFDEGATKALQAAAREAAAPVLRTIHRNEMILQAGHRVTPQDVEELRAYGRVIEHTNRATAYLGHTLAVLVLVLSAGAFLRIARPDVLMNGRLVWLIVLAGLLIVGVARILIMTGVAPEFRILVPVAACAVMLTVLLDWQVALGVGLFGSLAVAGMQEYGGPFLVQALLSTIIGVTTMGPVRRRSDFMRPGVVVGLTCAVLGMAGGLAQDAGPRAVALLAGIGLANGLVVAFVVPGLLTPLERLAGVTSDITLLEYSDLKHPLLVRMQQEAPGTFHHSLTMATLSEAAAEAIGANPLLARVGCYFHDIGKMVKPEYFAENQHGNNAHDRITPQMSALILNAHVKEGLDLGRQHRLSEPILGFIPEHQGTAIMVHFYKKALEQAQEDASVNENDYRYPGPKPQSKETAICMVADTVEAASRSLQDPTPARIQSMIYKLANSKFLDGQLDDCDLTLRDLNRICEAFTRVLAAMLHTRVAYPDEQTPKEIKEKVAGTHSQSQSTSGLPVPAPAETP